MSNRSHALKHDLKPDWEREKDDVFVKIRIGV